MPSILLIIISFIIITYGIINDTVLNSTENKHTITTTTWFYHKYFKKLEYFTKEHVKMHTVIFKI